LVLIRRDNVEHLLIIGGPTDVVVEQNIVRAAAALREAAPARPPAAADTLPRAVPLREDTMWPLQPQAAPKAEPAARVAPSVRAARHPTGARAPCVGGGAAPAGGPGRPAVPPSPAPPPAPPGPQPAPRRSAGGLGG